MISASDLDSRPNKRPRPTDDPHPPASPSSVVTRMRGKLKRHKELWFDNGSVVLVARNTGFRVFCSLLAEQSTVFADMFASSIPNAGEMLEGCPVVHLSDAAEDVANFLRVLCKPKYQQELFTSKNFYFPHISPIIRLAHKYHAQAILDQAIIRLHNQWFTTDFDEWETFGEDHDFSNCFIYYAPSVVNLARLTERHSLLPTAFYLSALLGASVLDGYKQQSNLVEHMSAEDIKRCIHGRNTLAEKAVKLVMKVFVAQPCEGRVTRKRCRSALLAMLALAVSEDKASNADVLASWKDILEQWVDEHGLCNLCTKAALERDMKARKEVWYSLPKIFNIEVDGWVPSASLRGGRNGMTATA